MKDKIKILNFPPRRVLSFDIEEWYHANYNGYDYKNLQHAEKRLDYLVPEILELLHKSGSRATFFVLGEIAKISPHIVKMIDRAGFPIGSHGMTHRLFHKLSNDEIESELKESKARIENIIGKRIKGFRAPCFAIDIARYDVLIDQLQNLFYDYDSSIVPVKYLGGGHRNYPAKPFKIKNIVEFPLGFWAKGGYGFVLSGGHFRFLPLRMIEAFIKKQIQKEIPVTLYLHPKDIDRNNPRLPLSFLYNIVHMFGVKKSKKKLEKMLSEYKFYAIEDYFQHKDEKLNIANKEKIKER
ncbi:MAG: polysaccharide deacetylase family protein [Candidatus Zixiibacteriota bacterium]